MNAAPLTGSLQVSSGKRGYVLFPQELDAERAKGARRHPVCVRAAGPARYDRFWDQVDQSGGLWARWPWLGPRRNGYGMLWHGNKRRGAHRIAFEMANGPVPAALDVLHTCDNPPCCNPAHLWTGTARDNLRDASAKGRLRGGAGAVGEASPRHKLTWAAVRDIRARQAAGESQRSLGRE
jgi:hypothetical protein